MPTLRPPPPDTDPVILIEADDDDTLLDDDPLGDAPTQPDVRWPPPEWKSPMTTTTTDLQTRVERLEGGGAAWTILKAGAV